MSEKSDTLHNENIRRLRRVMAAPLFMGVFWTLLLAALLVWNVRQEQEHVRALALRQARVFFRQVVVTRSWNAAHGGVYVLTSEDTRPNRHLQDPQRDLVTTSGVRLTRINPAYMTRQIADIARSRDAVQFRITGLKPKRPANTPDPWEKDALVSFRHGKEERFSLLNKGTQDAVFRYMAPLNTEQACLSCHVQDARQPPPFLGGISVSFPAASLLELGESANRRNAQAYGVIWVVGLLGISGFTLRLNRRREQAEEANRSKGMFLANISHDMRTPMQSIVGMSELLQREHLPQRSAELAMNLSRASRSLLEIINDVLDLSKIEAGKLELHPRVFSLRAAVQDCLDLVAFQCRQKGLELDCNTAPDVPDCLQGDSFRLRQTLSNLLGNAVKFTPEGFVHLEVETLKDHQDNDQAVTLLFSVRDSGPGIPEEIMPLLFKRFQQGQGAETIQGTGLGLAICKELVELMHGRIWAENLPHAGAQFSFTVRLNTAAPVMDEHKHLPTGALRILLVEDNATNRLFMTDALEEAGHQVFQAEDGARARNLLASQSFDLALVDLRLPDCFGDDLLREIRKRGERCGDAAMPLLAMSASAVEEDRERCLQAGASGFLSKPLTGEELLRAMAEALQAGPPTASGKNSDKKSEKDSDKDSTTNTPLLDVKTALERLGHKQGLFERMAAGFLEDAPEEQKQFQQELEQAKDSQAACRQALRLAHSLKNSAEMLGALPLHHKAREMEGLLRNNEVDSARKLAPDLNRLLHKTLALLSQTINHTQ